MMRSLALLTLATSLPCYAQETPKTSAQPSTATGIRDAANLFGLDASLKAGATISACVKARGTPIMVETIESTEGDEPAEVARRRSRAAGGGVYLLMVKDKKHLEGPLLGSNVAPKLEARRDAIRKVFVDRFKQNDYDGGLLKGVDAIVEALGGTEADTPLIARNQVRLTLAGARKVLAAAEEKAAALKVRLSIAIVDEGGHVLAFARMDLAPPGGAAMAEARAIDAAMNLWPAGLGAERAEKSGPHPGSSLIIVDGLTIGAVGVVGATEPQDGEVARVAAEALVKALKTPPESPR